MSLRDFLRSWLESSAIQEHLEINVAEEKKGIPSKRILDATEALTEEAADDGGLTWSQVNGNRHGDGVNSCHEAIPLGVSGHRSHNNSNELTGSL